MGLILLEAMGALVLLVLIVWWTMFSGREKGELPESAKSASRAKDGAEDR
jgi:cbb3-type cytochrome oxidase subunit 3